MRNAHPMFSLTISALHHPAVPCSLVSNSSMVVVARFAKGAVLLHTIEFTRDPRQSLLITLHFSQLLVTMHQPSVTRHDQKALHPTKRAQPKILSILSVFLITPFSNALEAKRMVAVLEQTKAFTASNNIIIADGTEDVSGRKTCLGGRTNMIYDNAVKFNKNKKEKNPNFWIFQSTLDLDCKTKTKMLSAMTFRNAEKYSSLKLPDACCAFPPKVGRLSDSLHRGRADFDKPRRTCTVQSDRTCILPHRARQSKHLPPEGNHSRKWACSRLSRRG